VPRPGPRVKPLSRAARGAWAAAQYLESPRLVRLRLRGVPRSLYVALDRPFLRALPIRTILDVGANSGQFALCAHALFPSARIHSFEPLPDVHAELARRTRAVPAIRTWNLALGERQGALRFERNDYTPSSSALPMAAAHVSEFPFTARSTAVEVEMARLDDLADRLELADDVLVKIDVQGYEDRVLAGGAATLRRARVALVETSFAALYEGQARHRDVQRTLEDWGFEYRGALDQLVSAQTGEVLAADSLFVRRDRRDDP
jgi:FkbM family methyltransferase